MKDVQNVGHTFTVKLTFHHFDSIVFFKSTYTAKMSDFKIHLTVTIYVKAFNIQCFVITVRYELQWICFVVGYVCDSVNKNEFVQQF